MIQRHIPGTGCFICVSFLLSASHLVLAQPPRTRTLVYDAERREWVEQPPPPPGSAAGDLHAMRVRLKKGDYRPVLSAAKRFVKKHGASDPLYPEVQLIKAEALIGRRNFAKAHEVLQAFLSEYGGAPLTDEALRLEFVIAEAFLGGAKRKVLGILPLSGKDLAYRILDQITADYPNSDLAELALKTKGDHLFIDGDHALAQMEYDRLLRDYPQTRYHRYALRRTADAALASFGGIEFDETPLFEAQERYREYRLRYPGEADREGVGLILGTIRERLAEKDFSIGAYYERTKHVSSAVFCYRWVHQQWPDTIASTRAGSRLELLGAPPAPGPPDAEAGDGRRAGSPTRAEP